MGRGPGDAEISPLHIAAVLRNVYYAPRPEPSRLADHPIEERHAAVRSLATVVRERCGKLGVLLTSEQGKPFTGASPSLGQAPVASVTLGQGQFCTKPGLLFLPAEHGLEDQLRRGIAAAHPAPCSAHGSAPPTVPSSRNSPATPPCAPCTSPRSRTTPGPRRPLSSPPPAEEVRACPELLRECFGPASLVITYTSAEDLLETLRTLPGGLTATIQGQEQEDEDLLHRLTAVLQAGRLIWNGWPTGVAVTAAMHHGGPWPATTSPLHTSVGSRAVARWMRPVAYQNMPEALLPPPLRRTNPWGVPQEIGGSSQQPG